MDHSTAWVECYPEDSLEMLGKNLCVSCGIDMGPDNPRQLCGKTVCLDIDAISLETLTGDDPYLLDLSPAPADDPLHAAA